MKRAIEFLFACFFADFEWFRRWCGGTWYHVAAPPFYQAMQGGPESLWLREKPPSRRMLIRVERWDP